MPRVKHVASPDTVHFARQQRHEPTKGERMLWAALRNGQLGIRFRRQHPIDIFVLDFCCEPGRLAVEIDGPLHEEQARYDRWRDAQLRKRGVETMRLPSEEVEADVVLVVDKIRERLREAGVETKG